MKQGLESKREFKSLVSSIKRINDDPNALKKNTYDSFKEDLGLKGNATKKTINDFTSKIKGRTQNTKDIFTDILDTVDGFISTEKEDPINTQRVPNLQSKTLRYAKQAAEKAIQTAKDTMIKEVSNGFFSGQGTCDPNTKIGSVSYSMSPKEFDFINMLKVAPTSTSGRIMYEAQPDPGIGIQFNRQLYTAFGGSPYTFETRDGSTLFSMTWNSGIQKYDITAPIGSKVIDFIDDYYSTIEMPNLNGVLNNAMLGTLQGDGTEPSSYTTGTNYMNRLLTKIFSLCGNPNNNESPFLNTPEQQLDEDELDIESYFNFDDVEGIDLDDEDSRKRRVLKFTDCNNFEVDINSNHIEDFSYLSTSKNIDENVDSTLRKAAIDAYEQADSGIYFEGFQLSLMKDYIKNIPRAMISTVLSPKMMFPVALSYQMLNSQALDVKDMMKELAKTFFNVIKNMFWTFIREFWGFVKRDLLSFVKDTAATILLNQVKKIKSIVLALISLLLKVLDSGIQSCAEIFEQLLKVLKAALNRSVRVPIPGLLLVLSESLPGFSADRAYMDALQRMENAGINVGDIYGSPNTLPLHVKSIIDAYSNEMDTNSYVKIALKPSVIPAGPGGAVISPLITGAGKLI